MLSEPGGLLPGDERKSFYHNYQYPLSLCNKTNFDKIIPDSRQYYETKQNLCCAGPGSAPRNVQVRPLSSSTMVIQWDEPEEQNGVVTGYKVRLSLR